MTPLIKVPLSAEALEKFEKPVNGNGGFQGLLRKLQSQIDTDPDGRAWLALEQKDLRRITGGVRSYGRGGFQSRLGEVLKVLEQVQTILNWTV